ncbi:MAG: SET domain-containing protein-lysine N-methyltransferase [Candidatus Hydrogenedentes bacterium]|nr:SET domain-containing protein-lysine N-methyltransferase [Candidatus Hydrogenedentota bacterium]
MSVVAGKVQHYPLAARSSRIHGKGMFARKAIPSNTVIYESDDYTTTVYAVYGSLQRTATEHLLEDLLRWENHSCVPNTTLRFDGTTVQLLSIRPIRVGEEIVCDYRTTEDSIPTPFRCNCGHCGGIMVR